MVGRLINSPGSHVVISDEATDRLNALCLTRIDRVGKLSEPISFDSGTNPVHKRQVKMYVMNGIQSAAQYLTTLTQVMQVSARVVTAGVTIAGRIQRIGIVAVACVSEF